MASYVFVWENNTFGHRKVEGYTWSGHSSMHIGDDFTTDESSHKNPNYVSWWPAESGAGFHVAEVVKSVFEKRQTGNCTRHLYWDCLVETYLPDHVIRLDTNEDKEREMAAAWTAVYMKNEVGSTYSNLHKNCSTIVSRVLQAAGICSQKWSENHQAFWTPADIRKLARGAGGAFLTWAAFNDIQRPTSGRNLRRGVTGTDPFTYKLTTVDLARSGRYCSTGVDCKYQMDEQFRE